MQHTAELDHAAPALGMPKNDRDEYTWAIRDTTAPEAEVDMLAVSQRYAGFHTHALGDSEETDLLDSRLNDAAPADDASKPLSGINENRREGVLQQQLDRLHLTGASEGSENLDHITDSQSQGSADPLPTMSHEYDTVARVDKIGETTRPSHGPRPSLREQSKRLAQEDEALTLQHPSGKSIFTGLPQRASIDLTDHRALSAEGLGNLRRTEQSPALAVATNSALSHRAVYGSARSPEAPINLRDSTRQGESEKPWNPVEVLETWHNDSLIGKKVIEDQGPDRVRARIEEVLGSRSSDTSVVQNLDVTLEPANFRIQHDSMINGGWRFKIHVDGKPYEIHVKATATAWHLDTTFDEDRPQGRHTFRVSTHAARGSDPRRAQFSFSNAGIEFSPTMVQSVNSTLLRLVTPSVKFGGVTHERITNLNSDSETVTEVTFTGETDVYTSDVVYQVQVTDHQGHPLGSSGNSDPIIGRVRAEVSRLGEVANGRRQMWQGWDERPTSSSGTSHALNPDFSRPAAGSPVSITGLEASRTAVYEALPREARSEGAAHQEIENFFKPSNVIGNFEHASSWGLLSKPLTLSDGSRIFLHLKIVPGSSRVLHTVDTATSTDFKSIGEHDQIRHERSSWSVGLNAGAIGQVLKSSKNAETTWLTGTGGLSIRRVLTHGLSEKNAISTEYNRKHAGKSDLVVTNAQLRVHMVRQHLNPGRDGLFATSITEIGDHSSTNPSQVESSPNHIAISIPPEHSEVIRVIPHDLRSIHAINEHPESVTEKLANLISSPRSSYLDFPGSSELEEHIVREMWQESPGILPPPDAVRFNYIDAPGSDTAAKGYRIPPAAWDNLRNLRQGLAPSILRNSKVKLLNGSYRIALKSGHLPLRYGQTHEIFIKAELSPGTYTHSEIASTSVATGKITGTDNTVARNRSHVISLIGSARSSQDRADVTRGFGNGNLDITVSSPSLGLAIGVQTEVRRQFTVTNDVDIYAVPVTYHVTTRLQEKLATRSTTDASTADSSLTTKQVVPNGHLTAAIARASASARNAPPPTITILDALPRRHAISGFADSERFRDAARQSLITAFEKDRESTIRGFGRTVSGSIPDMREALDFIADEERLRTLISASQGGWATTGGEQVGTGRTRDTIGLSLRTHLGTLRFRETVPGNAELKIRNTISGSIKLSETASRGLTGGLGFDAGRFPNKDSPAPFLQISGGFKGKAGIGYNNNTNYAQKTTDSREVVYKGTWHIYEVDADITIQGHITNAAGKVTFGLPQNSSHQVLLVLSDDDVRSLGSNEATTSALPGGRQARLLSTGLLGGAVADIPSSDEILTEIDRQIRGNSTFAAVPEAALAFADVFSPENLSANYEDLVDRGILAYRVHDSRTQRVTTQVLVRGIPRGNWIDEGDFTSDESTRKAGVEQTISGSAGHSRSLGIDGGFRVTYAPVSRSNTSLNLAENRAPDKKTGLGSTTWTPSLGTEVSRSKSAGSEVTAKFEHSIKSNFENTVKFSNRMRFEVTVTQRTEYGRFINLSKPRSVEPSWPVHVYVPQSLTDTIEPRQHPDPYTQQPTQATLDGETIEMHPLAGSQTDRDRWRASLSSALSLVGFDHTNALFDSAQSTLTTPRPWSGGAFAKVGSAIAWGLGSATSSLGRWSGAMAPDVAHRLVRSFISDPRLDGTDNPLITEQRLPIEEQFAIRRALAPSTLSAIFHQLKEDDGYHTVPFSVDGKTGLKLRLDPIGEAQEISTRENGSAEMTVSSEHDYSASATNGFNAGISPLGVAVASKNPTVVFPMPSGSLRAERNQTFPSTSPVTREPGFPTRTPSRPKLPPGIKVDSIDPNRATHEGTHVLIRQPVHFTLQKYDHDGTYGDVASIDGHLYYWAARAVTDVVSDQVLDHATSNHPPDPLSRSGLGGLYRGSRDVPRFVVSSGFDVRGFRVGGTAVTDLTVRVALRGGS
ncbi:hypothetical protein, partial [Streptomyces sp. NPDC094468]|uniref:hypothetical protein n=1 Tax=Streptomyces sp. NPDC094468 TaxID=3366066 RepID=UPI0037FDD048